MKKRFWKGFGLWLTAALLLGLWLPLLGAAETEEAAEDTARYPLEYHVFNGSVEETIDDWWSGQVAFIPISLWTYDNQNAFDDVFENYSLLQPYYPGQSLDIPAGTNVIVVASTEPCYYQGRHLALDSVEVSPQVETLGEGVSNNSTPSEYWYSFRMPPEPVTVTMHMHEKAIVRITAEPNDPAFGQVILSPENTGGLYDERSEIQISAIPAEGYTFMEWEEAEGSTYLSDAQKHSNTVQFIVGGVGADLIARFVPTDELVLTPIHRELSHPGKAFILLNDSAELDEALEGTRMTVTLDQLDEYYLFDHWEIIAGESAVPLIMDSDKRKKEVSFIVPADSAGVDIKAVLKDRYLYLGVQVGTGTIRAYSMPSSYSNKIACRLLVNGTPVGIGSYSLQRCDKLDFDIAVLDPAFQFVESNLYLNYIEGDYTRFGFSEKHGSYTLEDWPYNVYLRVFLKEEREDTPDEFPVTAWQPLSGGSISANAEQAAPGDTVLLSAAPEAGMALESWTVTAYETQVTVTPDPGDPNAASFSMPEGPVVVEAVFAQAEPGGDPDPQPTGDPDPSPSAEPAPAPEITAAELLTAEGVTLAVGTLSGDAWTLALPDDTDPEILSGLREQYLRLSYTGLSAAMEGGTDDAIYEDPEMKWSGGGLMCNMLPDRPYTFLIRGAEGAEKRYTLTILSPAPAAEPEPEKYTVSVAVSPRGSLSTDKQEAAPGEVVTVYAVPVSGYRVNQGTLCYSESRVGGSTVPISDYLFVMPASNVTVSCQWEAVPQTEDGGIVGMILLGREGAVNDAAGTVTFSLPAGTDLTALIPTVYTRNASQVWPGAGKTVDFSKGAVTFTLLLTDGRLRSYDVYVYTREDRSSALWEGLGQTAGEKPWWEYAEENYDAGDYPKYW